MIKGAGSCYRKECSYMEDKVHDKYLFIPEDTYIAVIALLKEMGNKEWLAILELAEDEQCLTVNKLIIPEQEVSSSSAEFIGDVERREGFKYGILHSHHTMGASFSYIDRESSIGNGWDINVVVNSSLNYEAEMMTTTPCKGNASVKIPVRTPVDTERFTSVLRAIRANAKEKVYIYAPARGKFVGGKTEDERHPHLDTCRKAGFNCSDCDYGAQCPDYLGQGCRRVEA